MVSMAYQASTIDIGFSIERLKDCHIIVIEKKMTIYAIKK